MSISAIDRRKKHRQQVGALTRKLAGNTQPLRVKKRTISNLFRYKGRQKRNVREVDLRNFNQVLFLNSKQETLEVQGLATFESIVDFTLQYGLTPTVTPELKHITIGGATLGIGIETNSYRHGFVHDSLLEADILLPSGSVVTCRPNNEYADLFHGLPNSYGTLGYILRAVIKLEPAKKYVRLHTEQFQTTRSLLQAMKKATKNKKIDYIESLIYSKDELYLTTSQQSDDAEVITNIYGKTIFYREVSRTGDITLTMKDYLFRYDPEWFWAIPDTPLYNTLRAFAPKRFRNSGFFNRFYRLSTKIGGEDTTIEHLIQDWEVPWKHSQAILDFAFNEIDLSGKPLMAAPLVSPAKATGYPMKPNDLYLNLGSYNFVQKQPDQEPYHHTKIMDEFCFNHDGIKMLYSTTFLDEKTFNHLYNGKKYMALKRKYDPKKLLPTLYEKAVKAY